MFNFSIPQHVKYHKRCLTGILSSGLSFDLNRTALIYFSIASLDLLNTITKEEKSKWRRWILDYLYIEDHDIAGFRSSPSTQKCNLYDTPQLAATYFGLGLFLILCETTEILEKLNIRKILNFLMTVVTANGTVASFQNIRNREKDLRQSFLFIACIHFIRIITKSGNNIAYFETHIEIDVKEKLKKVNECINSFITNDGAYSMSANGESHAGITFCAIAAKKLYSQLVQEPLMEVKSRDRLIRWLVMRANSDFGYNGRIGKDSDTCYVFWVIATLKLLDCDENYIPIAVSHQFLFNITQNSVIGGFAKSYGDFPDPYHSYLGLAALAINKNLDLGLKSLDPASCLSLRAYSDYA